MSSRVIRMAAIAGVTALTVFTATSCADEDGGADAKSTPAAAVSPNSDGNSDAKGEKNEKKQEGAHWSYEGADGPANWATLAEDFEACEAGREQSPIDLDDDKAAEAPVDKAVTIDYRPVTAELVNNGHTVQADVSAGSKIVIDGTSYDLKQFHFHLPSEHTEEGEHTAMEMHFVHADKNGKLAVVGVLMKEKAGTSAFADLFEKLPSEEGATEKITKTFDLTAFLPGDRDQYQYEGSLTTPPCTEGVKWTVLKEPVQVAPDEVAAYKELFPKADRPTQPLNDRELTVVDE
ncbi:carbonic anhydrase [Streptomyces sporangiiformans]|uniref:carbonic anhydrase n=1 Tax=Streptomyces sporangiiformans TaxID=2315329 RepID=A0A505DMS3_9ACTN|nr:carbonic anhydrase family protein [Streptomyces sporangiiformans]TPQ20881.1 carbonic anhydrase family protein [Streptomyces sporangiiformans]